MHTATTGVGTTVEVSRGCRLVRMRSVAAMRQARVKARIIMLRSALSDAAHDVRLFTGKHLL